MLLPAPRRQLLCTKAGEQYLTQEDSPTGPQNVHQSSVQRRQAQQDQLDQTLAEAPDLRYWQQLCRMPASWECSMRACREGATAACIWWACPGLADFSKPTSRSRAPSTRMLLLLLWWDTMDARMGRTRACKQCAQTHVRGCRCGLCSCVHCVAGTSSMASNFAGHLK